jgi:nitrate/nitrite transporter NarK
MGMIVEIILLLVFGVFVALSVTFIRLLSKDFDAVEIELRQVEGWHAEATQLDSE